jgi:DNA-binding CsgD family transcriptional regulator/PAS domain-containing protein
MQTQPDMRQHSPIFKTVDPASFYKAWERKADSDISLRAKAKSNFTVFDNPQFNAIMASSPVTTCIINHSTSTYEHYSENVVSLLGYAAQDFLEGGVPFSMSLIDTAHIEIVGAFLIPSVFEEIKKQVAMGEFHNIKLSFDFKMKRKNGESIWVKQIMTILEVDENGGPLLSVFHISDITASKKDENINLYVEKMDETGLYQIIHQKSHAVKTTFLSLLSDREEEILKLICHGYSSKEIADQLYISIHTVNTHRKNMLHKTKCKNSSELINFRNTKGLALAS